MHFRILGVYLYSNICVHVGVFYLQNLSLPAHDPIKTLAQLCKNYLTGLDNCQHNFEVCLRYTIIMRGIEDHNTGLLLRNLN